MTEKAQQITAWTDADVERLRKALRDGGFAQALIEFHGERSHESLRTKINRLGMSTKVIKRSNRPWAASEDKFLMANGGVKGIAWCVAQMPTRSKRGVEQRYEKLMQIASVGGKRAYLEVRKAKAAEDEAAVEAFCRPPVQIRKAQGEWKAEVPALRSVFDLGGIAA